MHLLHSLDARTPAGSFHTSYWDWTQTGMWSAAVSRFFLWGTLSQIVLGPPTPGVLASNRQAGAFARVSAPLQLLPDSSPAPQVLLYYQKYSIWSLVSWLPRITVKVVFIWVCVRPLAHGMYSSCAYSPGIFGHSESTGVASSPAASQSMQAELCCGWRMNPIQSVTHI